MFSVSVCVAVCLPQKIEDLEEGNGQLEEERVWLIRQKTGMLLQLCHHLRDCPTCPAPSLGLHDSETQKVMTEVQESEPQSITVRVQDTGTQSIVAGIQDLKTPKVMDGVQDSVSQSVMAGIHHSRTQSIMTGGQDSETQSIVADVQDSVSQSVIAGIRHSETQSIVASVQNLETQKVMAGVQDSETQSIMAGVHNSQNHCVVTGIHSSESHGVTAGASVSEAREVTTGLQHSESQSDTASVQDSKAFKVKASAQASPTTNMQANASIKHLDMNGKGNADVHNFSAGYPLDAPGTTQRASENSGATAKDSLVKLPQGFSQGAVFLQIVDGKVRLQAANERTESLGLERLFNTAVPATTDITLPFRITAVQDAGQTKGSMLLYHLDTSGGLPFFVMDKCLQTPVLVRAEPKEKHPRKSRAKRRSSSGKEIGTSGSSRSTTASVCDVQVRGDADEQGQPSPDKKQRTTSELYNNDARPKSSSEKYDVSQMNTLTVYEDCIRGDKNTGNKHNVSTSTSCASGGSKKNETRSHGQSLRDQTNVRFNQLYCGAPAEKQNLFSAKNCDKFRPLSRSGSVLKGGDPATYHDESVSSETLPSGDFSRTSTTIANTSFCRGVLPASESVQSSEDLEQVHGGNDPAGFKPGYKQTTDARRMNTNASSTSEETESSSVKYDPDFQNFLTTCFQSLDKPENPEERSSANPQGLVLLTSMELRFLASPSQEPDNSKFQKEAWLKSDLPSVDTVCLMNILKESSIHSGDNTPGEGTHKHHAYPMYLFSGLNSVNLDSENSLPTTTDQRKDDPLPQQGFYLLPLLQSSSHHPVSALDPQTTSTSQNSAVGGSAYGTDSTGNLCASDLFPTGPNPIRPAVEVNGTSPNTAEYNKLVESLLRGLASPGAATSSNGAS